MATDLAEPDPDGGRENAMPPTKPAARPRREGLAPPDKAEYGFARKAALARHAWVDNMILAGFRRSRQSTGAPEIDDTPAEAVALYRSLGWLDDPRAAYGATSVPETWDTVPERAVRFNYQHITFASGYQPVAGDPYADQWQAIEPNRTVHAWVMRHPGPPRPWLVCLHGTGMGRPLFDLGLFRANFLYATLGLNVAVPVLPLHGPRREGIDSSLTFPSSNPLLNLHGTLQAVWDTRRIIAFLRSHGNDRVGVTGVSLGGMIAALVGELDPALSCVILGAPVAELGALIGRHQETRGDERSHADHTGPIDRIISPLSMPAAIPHERRFIYAGVMDRMVHHRFHAGRLWQHWERPQALWFDGGHAGLGFDREVGGFIDRALRSSGLTGDVPRSR